MASRRKAPRQQSSSSGATQSQPGGDGGPNRQLLQQYAEGKKFKVKYLGSQDIEDYRNKRETSAIMADLKRRSSKAPKPKALISLFAKELIVMDEKSKTVTMKVPISKVKFVCHNKSDTSLFGVILATDRVTSESQRLHRMFCYQADPKIAAAFVRSVNELFQILAEIMRERRSRQEASNGSSGRSRDQAAGGGGTSAAGGGASGGGGSGQTNQSQAGSDGQAAGATGSDPMSDDERYEPVPLGFGIEAPPPSYKAAISKKNETIFKKPDDVQITVTTRLPPPPVSKAKKPAPPPPANRLSALPTSTGRINPPPTSQGRRTAAQPAPPTTTTTSQQAATPTSATSLPLPQVPVAGISTGRATGGATFNIGTTDEEDTGLDQSIEGNIYDVPTNNQPVPPNQPMPPNQSAQVQREAVWQEWQALESELQTIAQDLGFDMDSNNSTGAAVGGASAAAVLPSIEDLNIPPPNVTSEASFSEDPFADDFFQTSFSSPSVSLSSQSAWPGSNTSASGEQVVDPFSSSASFEVAWGTAEDTTSTSQATGVSVSSSEAADPFQEDLATPTGSSGGTQAATAHDPFQDTAIPTSPPVSFDFAGFSAGESPWNESSSIVTTTTSSITQAIPTASFDEDFGLDWSAFGGGTGTNTATSIPAGPQTPPEQDSQQEPTTTLSGPPPQVAIPRRAEATTTHGVTAASNTVMAPEDSFGASPAAVPPPPLSKRDSAILKPPPVSPTRRADAISNRNQSISSHSRPRPSPAKDQTQAPAVVAAATASSQMVLNRPPKSKSSPSRTRAYSSEIDPQPEEITIPSPDFGAKTEVASTSFDAMFDAPGNNQESGEVSLALSGMSDPFLQNSLPPLAGPPSGEAQSSASDPFQLATSTTSAQASTVAASSYFQGAQPPSTSQADNIGELFQDSLPPSSTSQPNFGDPFQGGISQASTQSATDQLSLGNPFQAVSPQHVPAPSSTAQQSPPLANDPFQDGFPPAAVSGSVSKTTSDDPFGGGGMVQPSTGSHDDPFQSSMQPPTTSTTKSQVQVGTAAVKSAPKSGSESGGGGDDWSGFGDMWSSKKQESTTSGDNWSAAFGGNESMKSAAKVEEPKEPANLSFSGFGDNWSGFPDQGKASIISTSASKPVAETSISTATSASQGKTESSWNAFGQDSFSTPSPAATAALSTAQSQPQVQQKQTKPTAATAGLLPPPSTSSKSNRPSGRVGGSPLSSQSRPRIRPSGERAPPATNSGLLNPPSSQSGSARGQAQTGGGSRAPAKESSSNPLNKSEVSTKKSGSYLDELSSLSGPSQYQQQPQFSPMNMSYPGAGGGGGGGVGGPFQQQQQPGGWGSPPGPNSAQSPPPSPQQPMQMPPQQQQSQQQAFQSYGGPQGPPGVQQGMTPQQQQQFMQQQQAMFMQQQQAMQQMQQGPPGAMQQGPPGSMQQGPPGAMQQGPSGSIRQGGYANNMQQMPSGQVAMQQGAMGGGVQFSPGGPHQMIRPPGQGAQMPPGTPQFSSPQQQQQYFYQQQQQMQQQNPNAFIPAGQPGNPLTPGNASMGGGQFAGANLSTSHLNASGFSSPPYAVGSSTPQSGTPGGAAAPVPADLPPPTVEYRPSVNDGRPDPFALLVTGALTPSKDGKVKGVDAEKLKAAFIKQPSPNRFPSPGPTYNNSQGGWV